MSNTNATDNQAIVNYNNQQQQQQQNGGTIVGLGPEGSGKLRCHTHDYETLDKNEFHQHFCDPANGHDLNGQTDCKSCGKIIHFTGIDYPPNLDFKCDECYDKYVDQHQKLFSKINADGSSTPTIKNEQEEQNSQQVTKEATI